MTELSAVDIARISVFNVYLSERLLNPLFSLMKPFAFSECLILRKHPREENHKRNRGSKVIIIINPTK